jgi:hypothetical protein
MQASQPKAWTGRGGGFLSCRGPDAKALKIGWASVYRVLESKRAIASCQLAVAHASNSCDRA